MAGSDQPPPVRSIFRPIALDEPVGVLRRVGPIDLGRYEQIEDGAPTYDNGLRLVKRGR